MTELNRNRNRLSTFMNAFTLSEVLITLGIIGVVAAMTIPTLIANTRSQQYRAKFKKTISTLSQAGRMAQAQYGFDYAGTTLEWADKDSNGKGCSFHTPDTAMSFCAIFNATLTGAILDRSLSDLPKINVNGKEHTYDEVWLENYPKANSDLNLKNDLTLTRSVLNILKDGTIVGYNENAKNCDLPVGTRLTSDIITEGELSECTGFIDVNGVSLPNKEVKCSTGETSADVTQPCVVDTKHLNDIFPIVFHNGIVEPASNAAAYVLQTTK